MAFVTWLTGPRAGWSEPADCKPTISGGSCGSRVPNGAQTCSGTAISSPLQSCYCCCASSCHSYWLVKLPVAVLFIFNLIAYSFRFGINLSGLWFVLLSQERSKKKAALLGMSNSATETWECDPNLSQETDEGYTLYHLKKQAHFIVIIWRCLRRWVLTLQQKMMSSIQNRGIMEHSMVQTNSIWCIWRPLWISLHHTLCSAIEGLQHLVLCVWLQQQRSDS